MKFASQTFWLGKRKHNLYKFETAFARAILSRSDRAGGKREHGVTRNMGKVIDGEVGVCWVSPDDDF